MKKYLIYGIVLLMGVLVYNTSCMDIYDDGDDDVLDDNTAAEEQLIINDWIELYEDNDADIDTTELGVYYTLTYTDLETTYPQDGDSLGIKYSSYFVDGTLLDSSILLFSDSTYKYVHSYDKVISGDLFSGLYDSVNQLNEGNSGIFLLPSELAWGVDGASNIGIPKYTPIVFVIELSHIYE